MRIERKEDGVRGIERINVINHSNLSFIFTYIMLFKIFLKSPSLQQEDNDYSVVTMNTVNKMRYFFILLISLQYNK